MNDQLKKAINVLNKGGIIIFPTDTVWGIGCRIDKPESIKKLYELRKRPEIQAAPVLVSSIEQAKEYYQDLPKDIEELLKKYWPGGLTVIYQAQTEKIPSLVRADKDTIGLRMPDQKDLLYLINKVGVPILGPSANFHGEKTPTSFSKLDPELVKLVDYVLPGECGGNQASTVIDCTKTPWKILREGATRVHLPGGRMDSWKVENQAKETILYIDTTDNQKVTVSINQDAKKTLTVSAKLLRAQAVLPAIVKLLQKNKLTLKDLTEIKVNTGPGSYTGIRVGLSVANALAYSLGIPVNGKKQETEGKYI